MNKAIVGLSFDDARLDNVYAFKRILFEADMPVTLNVTTGYVDRSAPKEKWPVDKPAMTIDDVKEIYSTGLSEIAIHGDLHENSAKDALACQDKLRKWLPKTNSMEGQFGFASPHSLLPVFFENGGLDLLPELAYVRNSLRIEKCKYLRIFARKIGRVVHLPILFKIAYSDTIMTECKDKVLYSVPVMKDTSVEQMTALVELTIKKKGAIIFMFHSISNQEDMDPCSWTEDKFVSFVSFLREKRQNDQIAILTSKSIYKVLSDEKID